jgi:hypothetical protein
MTIKVRSVTLLDIPAICCIHRYYIDNTLATWAYPGEYADVDSMRSKWEGSRGKGLPWVVAVDEEAAEDGDSGIEGFMDVSNCIGGSVPLPPSRAVGTTR